MAIDPVVEAAARERVDAFMASCARIGVEDLRSTAFSAQDPPGVVSARIAAAARADELGLTEVVREARQAAQDLVLVAFGADQFRPTLIGLNWGLSDGPARDRVAAAVAVADAATAAALEPFLQPVDLDALRSRYDLVDPGRAESGDPESAAFDGPTFGPDEAVLVVALVAILIVGFVSGLWVVFVGVALPIELYRRRRSSARRRAEASRGG